MTRSAIKKKRREPGQHPLASVQWVKPGELHANQYNPNHVFGPEFELLKLSILEDGWTQPVVAKRSGEIVDGFHRWTLAGRDKDIQELTGGLVPVVYLEGDDLGDQMISTVRHNRARGQHGILKMGSIVRALKARGLDEEAISKRLGMEREEVDRLSDTRGSPQAGGRESFGRGWVPDPRK